jgi:hypothetical protein
MMRTDVRTSDHWRVVRKFVQQVRTDAHELSVERSVIEEILDLCDHLGTVYVMDMIAHEKRVLDANPTGDGMGAFWAAKDAQDERDFERKSA